MDKLITFAIPCYNSAAFMSNCIESLLGAGDDTEIIIINDGSADNSGAVADSYAEKYPDKIRAIHQENGGHGAGVNRGIAEASGKYYKVVDSDDRLDPAELSCLLERIRENEAAEKSVDMYVTNYVYVRTDTGERRTMSYRSRFPIEKICTWDDVKPFGASQYLMMHSVVYRTELLREHGVELPRHTFYVDNLYMYEPFPYVKSIYYMDLDIYLYYVGRDEQSVSEKNMLRRIDQQVLVAYLMIDCQDLEAVRAQSRRLYRCMLHDLSIIMSISSVFLYMKKDKESIEKSKALWRHLKERDRRAYRKLRFCSVAAFTALPGALGRSISVGMYRLVHKFMKVN